MLVYIFCGIFGTSYVVNFVVIVLLLTLDFWTVRQGVHNCGILVFVACPCTSCHMLLSLQTKNISGRLLVGLRWWNETTDEGSNWRFETLEEVTCLAHMMPVAYCTALHSRSVLIAMCCMQGQRAINGKDSACFWWSLYAMVLSCGLMPSRLSILRLEAEDDLDAC